MKITDAEINQAFTDADSDQSNWISVQEGAPVVKKLIQYVQQGLIDVLFTGYKTIRDQRDKYYQLGYNSAALQNEINTVFGGAAAFAGTNEQFGLAVKARLAQEGFDLSSVPNAQIASFFDSNQDGNITQQEAITGLQAFFKQIFTPFNAIVGEYEAVFPSFKTR